MMSARTMAFAAAAACLACGEVAFAQVVVELRGGAADRVASAATPLDQGLELRVIDGAKGETREIVPWDEIRGVVASGAGAGEGRHPADVFLPMAEDLWRARIRVARRDAALARPLLEKHWDRLREASGPTAQLVAEGLLRATVEVGDMRAAVGPWIACLRLGSAGTPTRFPMLEPMLDDATGLLPAIPPFAPAEARPALVAAFAEAGAHARRTAPSQDPSPLIAASVARRMERLLALAGGEQPAAADPASAPDAPAVRVLAAIESIVAAKDARTRDDAVAAFDRLLPEPPAFLATWRLAAIGANGARVALATSGDARSSALVGAALENLAVPASGLDRTGLVDAYAIEVAEMLLREAGDAASASALATLKAERLREAAVRTGPATTRSDTSRTDAP